MADALFKVVLTGWATFVGCGGAREVVVQSSYWRVPQHNGDYMATGAYGGELIAFAGSWEPAHNRMVRIRVFDPASALERPETTLGRFTPILLD